MHETMNRKKRRMRCLQALAEKAQWRHDVPLHLSNVAPALTIAHFEWGSGSKFIDRGNQQNIADIVVNDEAYDFDTLREEGLIGVAYLHPEQNEGGQVRCRVPGLTVTAKGLEALAEYNRPLLRKVFDKQPATFVQIIVTVILAIATGVGGCGWFLGRQPAEKVHVEKSASTPEPVDPRADCEAE